MTTNVGLRGDGPAGALVAVERRFLEPQIDVEPAELTSITSTSGTTSLPEPMPAQAWPNSREW